MDPNGGPDAAAPAGDAAQRIKDSASTLTDRAKEMVSESASEGAQKVADKAANVASALRRAADDVEGEQAWLGTALRKSADGVERATRSLDGGDLNAALADVNGFARRQPALFLGASLALGFALARIGKAAVEGATPAPSEPGA